MKHACLYTLLASASLPLGGCGDVGLRRVDIAYFRFPDSTARAVHEITAADLKSAPRWELASTDSVVIGDLDGEAAFGSVSYALRLPDGRFIGADGTGARLLVLNGDGSLADEWGRRGAGPGEFQSPAWMGLCGTSGVHVFDRRVGTMTLYSWAGEVLDVIRLRLPDGSRPRGIPACNRHGDFAVVGRLERPRELREGLYRPFVTVVTRSARDGAFHDVVRIPGADSYRFPTQDGPIGDFGRHPLVAMTDSTLFIATGDAFEIAEYSFDGSLLAIIRANHVQRSSVTGDDVARVIQEQLDASNPQFHRRLKKRMATMEWPAFHPTVTGLLIDSEGCLWAQHNQPDNRRSAWWVLTTSGTPVGFLELPKKLSLTQANKREVIGYVESGSEGGQIVAYRYDRRGGSRC